MKMIPPGERQRSWENEEVENHGNPKIKRERQNDTLPPETDPVLQTHMGVTGSRSAVVNFAGISNLNGVYPPDTEGDVGPDNYFQMVNLSFAIWDKSGNLLYGPADNSTLWNGFTGPWTGTNDGDPIVIYDQLADRWLATQFAINTDDGTQWELLALSETGDPLGSYYRYAYEFDNMPDYPKLAVWPDGYYMSINQFSVSGLSWRGVGAAVFQRDAMLEGDPDAMMIFFNLGPSSDPFGMLPSDLDGTTPPPEGTPDYFAYFNDNSWGYATDHLRIWEFHTDWDTPANSTFTESQQIPTASFNYRICTVYSHCITQPVTSRHLDQLSDRLMYRLQYRNFGSYQTMVTNHTVNNGSNKAAVRWYELRDAGSDWYIYQQGTYSPDNTHRWMASVAMNGLGQIALGYSVSSTSIYPSIRYTGRTPGAAAGTMNIAETEIMTGSGYQTGTAERWGDYSMMAVDPSDDSTFWYTQEYIQTFGVAPWKTRIVAFTLVNDMTPPAAITDLSDSLTNANAIVLKWTAPGDDGNTGVAYAYDIRYSLAAITAANFNSASQVTGAPAPQTPGTVQTCQVSGLLYDATYWFAMKTLDEAGNPSGISNVVSKYIPAAPAIGLSPESFNVTLFQDSISVKDLIISNSGGFDLTFDIEDFPLWLSVDDTSGIVSSEEGSQTVSMTFDATGLADGNYSVSLTVTSNDPSNSSVVIPISLTVNALVDQTVTIPVSWSGLSSYVIPLDETIENLFLPVEGDLIILQDMTGVYWPEVSLNTIIDWDTYSGYRIKMSQSAQLMFTGAAVDDKRVPLAAGWNIIPVLSSVNVSSTGVFGPLADTLTIAKEVAGNKIYWPNEDIYTLQTLYSGKAYIINVKKVCSLVFPDLTKGVEDGGAEVQTLPDNPWNAVIPDASSHIIAIRKEAMKEVKPDDIIGVFTPQGFCAGILAIARNDNNQAVIVYGDDPTTPGFKEGLAPGEPMTFRLYRPATGTTYLLAVIYDEAYNSHDGLFRIDGLSAVSGIELHPLNVNDHPLPVGFQVYPNPATDILFVHYDSDEEMRLRFISILGEDVRETTITGSSAIDVSTMNRGMYYLEITPVINKNWSVRKKIIIYGSSR